MAHLAMTTVNPKEAKFCFRLNILYNGDMSPTQEYYPELLSRKGEITAWLSTALVFTGWLILGLNQRPITPAIPFLGILLCLSALGISLGNWMDRQTRIQIFSDSIHFENGIRNTRIQWEDIQQVQIFPSAWGKKVRVIGQNSHFDFRTLGEVKVQGELKGKLGFSKGETILAHILEETSIPLVNQSGNSYYYARK